MTYQSLYQTNFSAGEWSPQLRRRSDLQRYVNACDTAENVVIRRQGGAVRRSGSYFIDFARRQNDLNRLIPFIVSQDQSYLIELSFQGWRVINSQTRDYIRQGFAPFNPVNVGGQPWITDDRIANLRYAQSGDVMWVVHPEFAPRTIRRISPTSFAGANFDFRNGPFLPLTDSGIELSFSALSGNGITVTASSSFFQAGHTGAFFLVLADDLSGLGKWQGNTAYNSGDRVLSDGKIYEAGTTATSGANAPQHTRGIESDGSVDWEYQSSLYAVIEITGVTNGTTATANVVSESDIPDSAKSNDATEFWAEGAWSSVQGWPDAVAFYQQRIWFAKGQTLYGSVLGDFDNFNPFNEDGLVDFGTAITISIDDDRTDPIKWMVPMVRMVLGTPSGEKLVGEQNTLDPFGATNIKIDTAGFHGSRDFVVPQKVNNQILSVGRDGKRVYEMTEDILQRRVTAPDRAIFSDHLLKDGGFEATYAQSPDSLYIVLNGDGTAAVMTYEPSEEVYAWSRWTVAGKDAFIESIAAMPSPDGLSDDIYMIVFRVVNGQGQRTLERIERTFMSGDDQQRAAFTDSSVLYEPGSPITTVPDLDHLEGETVQVVADGLYVGTAVVSGGQITVAGEPDKVVVGLPYTSSIVPVTPDPGSAVGASKGHRQRAVRAHILLFDTIACRVGIKGGSTFDLLELRTSKDPMSQQIEPRTRIIDKSLPESNWDTETLVEVRSDLPLPMAVRGIVFDMVVSNR